MHRDTAGTCQTDQPACCGRCDGKAGASPRLTDGIRTQGDLDLLRLPKNTRKDCILLSRKAFKRIDGHCFPRKIGVLVQSGGEPVQRVQRLGILGAYEGVIRLQNQ